MLNLYAIIGLALWGIAAPVGTWAMMEVGKRWEVSQARSQADKVARADERNKCTAKIGDIERKATDETARQVAAAMEAASQVKAVPVDDPGLRRMCNRHCSDREHQAK